MKKLFTLLLVLTCYVGTASAANVTKRFYVVNEITNWDGWGSNIKIHVFYNDGTNDVNLTDWNSVTMTKVCDISGETNKALYYKDLEIDEDIVNNHDLQVIFIANNYSSHENDWHYKTYQESRRYTSDYVYYLWNENNGSSVGRNSEVVTYYLASWPTGDNPTRTFTALTGDNGVYSADIDIPTEATFYCLAPSFALSYTNSTPTNIKWWDAIYRRNSEGDYWIKNFQFYTDGRTLTKRSSGKTYDNGIWYYPSENGLTTKSKFDFDIINMTFTVKPYFTRTTSNNPNSTGYMTYSSAYKTAIPDGISAYYASGLSNGEVVLTQVSNGLWNDKAYMLKGEKNTEYTFYATDATPSDVPSENLLKASVENTPVAASVTGTYHYFFSSNPEEAFYRLESDATSLAGKAYLETSNTIGSTATGAKLTFMIDDSETASIKDATAVSYDENAPMYNLAGQRVANNFKGVVIQNGKKFIVK